MSGYVLSSLRALRLVRQWRHFAAASVVSGIEAKTISTWERAVRKHYETLDAKEREPLVSELWDLVRISEPQKRLEAALSDSLSGVERKLLFRLATLTRASLVPPDPGFHPVRLEAARLRRDHPRLTSVDERSLCRLVQVTFRTLPRSRQNDLTDIAHGMRFENVRQTKDASALLGRSMHDVLYRRMRLVEILKLRDIDERRRQLAAATPALLDLSRDFPVPQLELRQNKREDESEDDGDEQADPYHEFDDDEQDLDFNLPEEIRDPEDDVDDSILMYAS
ncbi:MAG: hypothetical protein MHM6MM_004405 [Cercozoa sp. M6MM]